MSEPDEIQAYIERYGPHFHEALTLKQDMEKYPSIATSQRLVRHTNEFQRHMQSFLSESTDNEAIQAFSKKCTWKQAQEEAAEALKQYQKEGKSWRHPFQTTGRAAGNVASRLEFLLELLPRGEYTSVLFGGLALAFNAAKRMKAIRELVFKTFDGLSDTLDHKNVLIRCYSGDESLRQKAEDLYIATLDAVMGITNWLRKNPLKESVKAFFQQEGYGIKLEEKMTNGIQYAAAAFEECIKALLHGKVDHIDTNVTTIKYEVSESKTMLLEVKKGMKTFQKEVKELNEKKMISDTIAEHLADFKKSMVDQNNEILNEMRKNGVTRAQQNRNFVTNVILMPIITIQQLLGILDAGLVRPDSRPRESISDTIVRDRDSVFHFGRSLHPSRQEGIATIMQDPHFQSWIKSAGSHTLVINGMEMDSHWQETISPMSYMCYLLSETLFGGHSATATSLKFYCGLHSTPGENIESAGGMLRSIITQLLRAHGQTISLSFLDLSAIQCLQSHNIHGLLFLLERLLAGIGAGIVIIMIDGISWYENDARLQETTMVMRFLNSLVEAVEASQSGLVLKLMVTSPTMSRYSREWFPAAAEVCSMPGNFSLFGGGIPGGGGVDEYYPMLMG